MVSSVPIVDSKNRYSFHPEGLLIFNGSNESANRIQREMFLANPGWGFPRGIDQQDQKIDPTPSVELTLSFPHAEVIAKGTSPSQQSEAR